MNERVIEHATIAFRSHARDRSCDVMGTEREIADTELRTEKRFRDRRSLPSQARRAFSRWWRLTNARWSNDVPTTPAEMRLIQNFTRRYSGCGSQFLDHVLIRASPSFRRVVHSAERLFS